MLKIDVEFYDFPKYLLLIDLDKCESFYMHYRNISNIYYMDIYDISCMVQYKKELDISLKILLFKIKIRL